MLPWSKQYPLYPDHQTLSCEVEIRLLDPNQHDEDISSWSSITSIGSLLLQACRASNTGYAGGWATLGDENYMKITIAESRYFRRPGLISAEVNSTSIEAQGDSTQRAPGSDPTALDSE